MHWKDQLRDGGSGGCGGRWWGVGGDTGCGVALAEAHFADEETKAKLANTRSGLTSLQNISFFSLETLSVS